MKHLTLLLAFTFICEIISAQITSLTPSFEEIEYDTNKINVFEGYENAKVKITSPDLFEKTIYAGYTGVGEKNQASFKVKVAGNEVVKGKIKLSSTRGGMIEREFTLK